MSDQNDIAVDYNDSSAEYQHVDDNVASDPRDSAGEGQRLSRDAYRGAPTNVLFISRFTRTTSEKDIEDLLKPFGPIENVVIRDKIAFVGFVNVKDAELAKQTCHYKPGLGSDSLIVDFKKDREDRPRRDRDRDYPEGPRGGSGGYSGGRDRYSDAPPRYPPRDRSDYPPSYDRPAPRGGDYGAPPPRYDRYPADDRRGPPRDFPPRDLPPRDLPPYRGEAPPPRRGYNDPPHVDYRRDPPAVSSYPAAYDRRDDRDYHRGPPPPPGPPGGPPGYNNRGPREPYVDRGHWNPSSNPLAAPAGDRRPPPAPYYNEPDDRFVKKPRY